MKLLNVSCNHCGAPLEVPSKARFVTCTFCDSRLEVERSGTVYFTSVLEAVGDIKEDVKTIKLQNELERVDREWTMQRQQLMSTDKHGRVHVPTQIGGVIMIVVGMIAGFIALSVVGAIGFVFIAIGSLGGIFTIRRAQRYEASRMRYQQRRRKALKDLRGG